MAVSSFVSLRKEPGSRRASLMLSLLVYRGKVKRRGAGSVRGRTGQGKPLSVRFAHSPGFSGMVHPTWAVKATKNPGAPFAEGFYCPARARAPERPSAEGFYCPARARAPERPSAEGFYWPAVPTAPPPGLACRLGSCAPVGRVQDRPKRELRPVRGRAPPALAHPLP